MECYICLLERAIRAVQMIGKDRETVLKVAKKVSELLINEFNFEASPAVLGTKREWIISEILGEKDPYDELKAKSNDAGLRVAEKIFSGIDLNDTSYSNFRRVMILAAAANATEWFIRGHEFSLDRFEENIMQSIDNVAIDDSKELYNMIRGKNILYTLDNAGEAMVDLYVVKFLKNIAKNVYVSAKSRPVLNDITVEEAKKYGFDRVADRLVGSGPYVGVYLDGAPKEFMDIIEDADIILAKGMGAYETITEYELGKPVFVLLKAKCVTIARALDIPQGSLAIKRIE